MTEPSPSAPPPLPPAQSLNYQASLPPPYAPYGNVKPAANFGQQAAKASWVAPIVAVFLNVASNGTQQDRTVKGVIGFASLGIYLIGLVLGIIALTRVRKFGRAGILTPAIVGVCINGALVLLFAGVIVAILMR